MKEISELKNGNEARKATRLRVLDIVSWKVGNADLNPK